MAQIKYRKNDVIELNFSIDVEGTSNRPEEVKLIIVHGQKHYAVVATPNDSKYRAEFDLDTIKDLKDESKLDLILQIEMKGRVFRPLKRQIEIIDYDEVENQTAQDANTTINNAIQNTEIHEAKKVEKPEEIKQEDTPKKTPLWAKDIFTGTDIPPSIETEFSDVVKDILKGKSKEKDQKVTIKFDKPNKSKKEPKDLPKPIEITPIEQIPFNPKVVKKKLTKRKVQEAFTITEGQIKYL